MEERIRVLALLLIRKQRVSLDELRAELRMPDEVLLSILSQLPASLEGGEVIVSDVADMLLALWGRGFDPVELALKAGWRDFERLCSRILQQHGFETLMNVRLKASKRRLELDVVAFREPWVLAVDCKRWMRRRESHLRAAARLQKVRCELLARELVRAGGISSMVARWGEARVVPAIVGVHETSVKVYEGVPIVPLRKLPSFLCEFDAFVDELHVVRVALK